MTSNFFSISSGAMDRAEEELRAVVKYQGVKNGLLMDHGGYVFLHEGSFPFLPPQEMGAIISGAFASLNTLVSMTAATDLTVKFHDSPLGCLMLSQVTKRILLAVTFAEEQVKDETQIRGASQRFVDNIRPLIEADESAVANNVDDELPFSSVQYIEDKLSDLFDDF